MERGLNEYAEEKADEKPVSTFMMKFSLDKNNGYSLVVPEVHPGPFLSVGGSNLPYVLYNAFSGRAMVLHGVSDHALNIPSKEELDKYISGLKTAKKIYLIAYVRGRSELRMVIAA